MNILNNFEFNKVNKDVEEEIKYLQLPNKIKYFAFWGSIIASTVLVYNSVSSNLTSVSQKASLSNGNAPIIAFFETNWESKAEEIRKSYEADEKIFNEKVGILRQIDGNSSSQITINSYIKTLNEDEIISIIKSTDDYKKMVSFENKTKLLSLKDEITLGENKYKIVDILNKLINSEPEKKEASLEVAVSEIYKSKVIDIDKDDLKILITELIGDRNIDDASTSRYKTVDEMLKASVNQIRRNSFELSLNGFGGISLGGGNSLSKISLSSTKEAIEKLVQLKNDEINKKVEDSKNKIESITKEIEDLKILQMKRMGFIGKVESLTTSNYYESKEDLKKSFDELTK